MGGSAFFCCGDIETCDRKIGISCSIRTIGTHFVEGVEPHAHLIVVYHVAGRELLVGRLGCKIRIEQSIFIPAIHHGQIVIEAVPNQTVFYHAVLYIKVNAYIIAGRHLNHIACGIGPIRAWHAKLILECSEYIFQFVIGGGHFLAYGIEIIRPDDQAAIDRAGVVVDTAEGGHIARIGMGSQIDFFIFQQIVFVIRGIFVQHRAQIHDDLVFHGAFYGAGIVAAKAIDDIRIITGSNHQLELLTGIDQRVADHLNVHAGSLVNGTIDTLV